jgi:hypothetical protein
MNPKCWQAIFSPCSLLHAGVLFGLFVDPENEGDIIIQNVD